MNEVRYDTLLRKCRRLEKENNLLKGLIKDMDDKDYMLQYEKKCQDLKDLEERVDYIKTAAKAILNGDV